jgi:hypothetical protein
MGNGHAPAEPPRGRSLRPAAALARFPRLPRGDPRRFLLVALATVLCLVTAGLSLAVFFAPGSSRTGRLSSTGNGAPGSAGNSAPVNAGSSAPAAAGPSGRPSAWPRPAAAKPKTAAHPVTEDVLTWPAALGRQMTQWAAGPGGATLSRLETELGVAMQTAGLKLYVQMKQACGRLASDTSAARTGPPIPDHVIQGSYAQALAGLSRAASDCRTAISVRPGGDETTETRVNAPLLSRARLELAVTSKQLYRATSRLSSLHH